MHFPASRNTIPLSGVSSVARMTFPLKTAWIVLLALIAISTLASAQKIETSIDSDYNFAQLKTFAFSPLNPRDALNKTPERVQQIKQELTASLQKIGFHQDDAHPDFLVSYTANDQSYDDSYTVSANAAVSENQVVKQKVQVQTLVVDLLDAKTKQPFWQATSTRTVADGSFDTFLPKAVKKTIETFQKEAQKQRKKLAKG